MSSTSPAPDAEPQAESSAESRAEPPRTGFVEAVLDNLPAWAVVAAAIAFLYLVWATLEILSRYVEGIPSVTP